MAAGQWWTSEEEYRYIECYVVVAMCLAANILEMAMHALKHLAGDQRRRESDPRFYELLFTRASSELMVLGFLAFVVWVCNRTQAFDAIAARLPDPYAPCYAPAGGGDDSSYRRALAAAPSSSSSSAGGYGESDACKAVKATRVYERKLFRYPGGTDLLHIVEDVHMEIFVAMCLYFVLMSVTVSVVKRMCLRWTWWEEHMREYQHFPPQLNRAGFARLLSPLSDVKDFFKAKHYFIAWAQSGALRRLEERRARREAGERTLHGKLVMLQHARAAHTSAFGTVARRRFAADGAGSGGGASPAGVGKGVVGTAPAGERVGGKVVIVIDAGAMRGSGGGGGGARGGGAGGCRAARDDSMKGMLDTPEMVGAPGAARARRAARDDSMKGALELSAVGALPNASSGRVGAGASVSGGSRSPSQTPNRSEGGASASDARHAIGPRRPRGADARINDDFSFGAYLSLCYVQLLADMIEFQPATWSFVVALTVAEGFLLYTGADEVLIDLAIACCTAGLIGMMWLLSKWGARAMLHAAETGSIQAMPWWFEAISQRASLEVFFLRLLQALTWRNLFRLVVFFLGEELRTLSAGGASLISFRRLVALILLFTSSSALPTTAYGWGLAMFLPPHVDEKEVEIAELVCWRQKHPLHSFSAPWEQPLVPAGAAHAQAQ